MKINMFPQRHCLATLFLLALPTIAQAQFTFITNNNAITITGYTGPGGAVVLPATINGYNVNGIGEGVFAYYTNLDSITITATNVASFSIGAEAFVGCTSLADILFTNNVTSIGEEAFYGCSSLTNIVIPSSVTNIGMEAFVGCASLTNISVNSANPSFSSLNGVLFDKNRNTLIAYPEGLTNSTYAIPQSPVFSSSVTNIGPYAFASCIHLTTITIPCNVGTVGDFAFTECTNLTSVTTLTTTNYGVLLNRPTISWQGPTSLGVAAFTFCTSLTNVVIVGTVTNIGGLAFAFCPNLASAYFGDNAPLDAGNAFYGDPDTIVYYLPGTTDWGATFGGAPTVETPTPASDFRYQLYNDSIIITGFVGPDDDLTLELTMSPLGAVAIPSTINGYPVTTIGTTAFEHPAEVQVTSVSIPNSVTNIAGGAFQQCDSLTSIIIPGSIVNIGEGAFESCGNLTSVTIDNGVTSIGEDAFNGCYSLISVTIPTSVTSIGEGAFEDCESLTISVDAANPSYSSLNGVLFDKAQHTLIEYPAGLKSSSYTIPNSVTNIETFAFGGGYNPTLTAAYFQGNAPLGPGIGNAFDGDTHTVVYYLPGTSGWGTSFGGAPTELWNPQATALTTTGGQFGFNITGPTNATIVVEACTNLANPVWLPLSTNVLSANGASSFNDPHRTNYPSRYYRFSSP